MLDIEYKGANTVVLATKKTTLVTDPKLSLVGLKDESVKDAIQLATEARFLVKGDAARLTLEGPGEYEVGDFSITGVAAQRHIDGEAGERQATIYRIETGDIRVALLGNIAPKLSEDQLETLGIIDILIIPVGGTGYTLDATSAAAIARQIEPKVVIPIHYADAALTYEVPQEELEVFTTELSAPVETVAKYKLKSAAGLPEALTTVVVTRS